LKYEFLSQNIKKIRKNANLTQKELGEKIYKSEILIRKYESGKINIPPSTLYDICAALEVTPSTLLGSEYNNYSMDKLGKVAERNIEVEERLLSVTENFKKYGDASHKAVTKIESSSPHLLNTILRYLENTEEYYSPLYVNLRDVEKNTLPYLTNEQVNDIVSKVTSLVKYEIYKLEK